MLMFIKNFVNFFFCGACTHELALSFLFLFPITFLRRLFTRGVVSFPSFPITNNSIRGFPRTRRHIAQHILPQFLTQEAQREEKHSRLQKQIRLIFPTRNNSGVKSVKGLHESSRIVCKTFPCSEQSGQTVKEKKKKALFFIIYYSFGGKDWSRNDFFK